MTTTATGEVKFFKDDGWYGFIVTDDVPHDVHSRGDEIVNRGWTPERGDLVQFDLIVPRNQRPYAKRVERISAAK
jgi:cold shock CspA family protein